MMPQAPATRDGRWQSWLLVLALLAIGIAFLKPLEWPIFAPRQHAAIALLPGLTVEDAPPPEHGLIVTSLRSGSEAAGAGIAIGDDIEALDGHAIGDLDEATAYLKRDARPTIVLTIDRDSQRRMVRLPRGGGGGHGA